MGMGNYTAKSVCSERVEPKAITQRKHCLQNRTPHVFVRRKKKVSYINGPTGPNDENGRRVGEFSKEQ
jgi:hypothetical protein